MILICLTDSKIYLLIQKFVIIQNNLFFLVFKFLVVFFIFFIFEILLVNYICSLAAIFGCTGGEFGAKSEMYRVQKHNLKYQDFKTPSH